MILNNIKENFNYVKNVYKKLYSMVNESGFVLLDDGKLKETIQKNYEQIQKKENSQTTNCAVFDGLNRKAVFMDGLIKDYMCDKLDRNMPYLFLGSSSKLGITKEKVDTFERVIVVPPNRWKILENSSIMLSPKSFENFYLDLMKRNNTPDVILLVLASPKELLDKDIQSFILNVGQEFRDGNFFLVFNEAGSETCTNITCTDCFPQKIRSFLDSTKINFNERIFKVSTSKYCIAKDFDEMRADSNSNTFGELRQVLEHELNINTVLEKINRKAAEIYQSLVDIQKSFNIPEVKESIQQYGSKLEEETPILNKQIDNYEEIYSENILKKKNETNKDILRNMMENYTNFKENFGKELTYLLEKDKTKNNKKNIGKMSKKAFFEKHLTSQEMKKIIKKRIDLNFQWKNDLKEEFRIENEVILEKFKQALRKTNKEAFAKVKKIFKNFTLTFESDAVQIVEEIKNTIDKEAEELKWFSKISSHTKLIEDIIRNKKIAIQNIIDENWNQLAFLINQNERRKGHSKFNEFCVSRRMKDFNISSEIKSIKTEINLHVENIPPNETKSTFIEEYYRKLFNCEKVDECACLCEENVLNFLSNFHKEENDELYENQTNKIYLKELEILTDLLILKHVLLNNVEEIRQQLQKNIKEALEFITV